MSDKQKIQWIESIKFIAALSVFWGHFYLTFYSTRADRGMLQGASRYLVFLGDHVFRIFVDGNYWVFVFCLLGGYFASKKRVESIRELANAITKRYLRFAIPMLLANIMALLIQNTVGYHAQEFAAMIGSSWFATAYSERLSIADAIRSAVMLTHEFNGAFWVVRPIFLGSCGVYLYLYIKNKLNYSNFKLLPDVVICFCLWLSYFVEPLREKAFHALFFCAGGVLLRCVWGNLKVEKEGILLFELLLIAVVLTLDVDPFMEANEKSILAFAQLIAMFYVQPIKTVLEKKGISKYNQLSFGIFAVHGPLLFSLSIVIHLWLNTKLPYSLSVVLNLIISTLLVVGVSYLYTVCVQMLMSTVWGKLKSLK